MQIKEVLFKAKQDLSNSETPELDSEVLLAHILNKNRLYLYTHPEIKLSSSQLDSFNHLLNRRKNNEPIAYILGSKEFMGLHFKVTPDVLIPRPETETVTEEAIRLIKERDKLSGKVLDLCCGSGCIGITLKKTFPDLNITLSDVSERALEVARENCQNQNVSAKLVSSDLFENINDSYDLIISNPPYIPENELVELQEDVIKFEPVNALGGGSDGYYFYRKIASYVTKYLNNEGILILEVGYNQGDQVKELLERQNLREVKVLKDLSGFDRIVTAYK